VLFLAKEAWYISYTFSKFGIVEKCLVSEREDKTQKRTPTISIHLSTKLGEREAGNTAPQALEKRTLLPDRPPSATGHGGQAAIGGGAVPKCVGHGWSTS